MTDEKRARLLAERSEILDICCEIKAAAETFTEDGIEKEAASLLSRRAAYLARIGEIDSLLATSD